MAIQKQRPQSRVITLQTEPREVNVFCRIQKWAPDASGFSIYGSYEFVDKKHYTEKDAKFKASYLSAMKGMSTRVVRITKAIEVLE